MGIFYINYYSSEDEGNMSTIVVYFTKEGKYWVSAGSVIEGARLEERKDPIADHVSPKDQITWGELKKQDDINDVNLVLFQTDSTIFLSDKGLQSLTANTTERNDSRYFKLNFDNVFLPSMVAQCNLKRVEQIGKRKDIQLKEAQAKAEFYEQTLGLLEKNYRLEEEKIDYTNDVITELEKELKRRSEVSKLFSAQTKLRDDFLKTQEEVKKEYEILLKENLELKTFSNESLFMDRKEFIAKMRLILPTKTTTAT
ncbi:hypothetical protein DLEV_097 [Diachasmimorpha longicaudata entomopoxvirus]|uniref:Uncharacterized protein n=1 Tax=Diachasmimorpha longicaudata entomopoxvirus TaxID=109981 RepID=A0A7R5WS06_9POXV|nr:hypothetical protein QKK69_gp097 [Diachasmimorpha longicaudata entomopoxvirus]AKS26388.1 hypothetical protein DLEV_097 [Diachasmimorpha longicaudata entomopoxvirus]